MKGYKGNIEELTVQNNNFRKVLFTGPNMQLVVMSLLPGQDIGSEVHPHIDQFFRVEEGEATVVIDGESLVLHEDEVAIVPAGSEHNVINNSSVENLKLYTIYTPPEHADGTVHATKSDAQAAHHDH